MSASPVVHVDIDDAIATITLDSQHNRNALSRQLLAELHQALDTAEAAEARAIVLTHRGPAFCAGADLKERSSQGGTDRDSDSGSDSDSNPFVEALVRLMDTERPTIAAVNGAVRAGGIGLMAACDLVVVAASTTFALTEVRIGVAPAIISVPILRRVAPSRIAAAMLTGESFDAHEARSMGLITHVSADVAATVEALTAGILAGAPTCRRRDEAAAPHRRRDGSHRGIPGDGAAVERALRERRSCRRHGRVRCQASARVAPVMTTRP